MGRTHPLISTVSLFVGFVLVKNIANFSWMMLSTKKRIKSNDSFFMNIIHFNFSWIFYDFHNLNLDLDKSSLVWKKLLQKTCDYFYELLRRGSLLSLSSVMHATEKMACNFQAVSTNYIKYENLLSRCIRACHLLIFSLLLQKWPLLKCPNLAFSTLPGSTF